MCVHCLSFRVLSHEQKYVPDIGGHIFFHYWINHGYITVNYSYLCPKRRRIQIHHLFSSDLQYSFSLRELPPALITDLYSTCEVGRLSYHKHWASLSWSILSAWLCADESMISLTRWILRVACGVIIYSKLSA